MITDTKNENPYDNILKIQSYRDWRYSEHSSNTQFQQFASNRFKDKNFNYILCRMLNNQGAWCPAK